MRMMQEQQKDDKNVNQNGNKKRDGELTKKDMERENKSIRKPLGTAVLIQSCQ